MLVTAADEARAAAYLMGEGGHSPEAAALQFGDVTVREMRRRVAPVLARIMGDCEDVDDFVFAHAWTWENDPGSFIDPQ